MSTVFIAVECFQCSTMQVKQKKKSSNKWNCVVCNEKQSVRKVFAHGFMAKDVRKFVQTFNMSRQRQSQTMEEETLDQQQQTENQPPTQKRTDWSDYIDLDDNDSVTGDDQMEPNFVTELPKPLFKNPKLSNKYSASAAGLEDCEQLQRPVFGNRNLKKKKVNSPGNEPGLVVKENSKRVAENQYNHDHGSVYGRSNLVMANIQRPNSKLNACADVDGGYTGSSSVMVKLKRPVSKWNKFTDDDADGWQLESGCEEINHAAFETKVSDEIVEDDVHPDFM